MTGSPRSWRNAVFAVFFVCGWLFGVWFARLATVRDTFGADTDQMSLLMVGLSTGSVTGLLASSHLVALLGSRRVIALAAIPAAIGMCLAGIGTAFSGGFYLSMAGLCLFGVGLATTDVAMNVTGAANERVLGRTIMPLFHAMFSFGTVMGAAAGALTERTRVPVVVHVLTAVALAGIMLLAVLRYLPAADLDSSDNSQTPKPSLRERLAVWTQPLTIAIGLVVLGMSLAEGAAGDWLAMAVVDGRGMSNTGGAVMFWVFVVSMTTGRVFGVLLLDRFGRVPVLRACALSAVIGLALVIWLPWLGFTVVGTVLWGLGASLGFPVGMSAAADDPRQASARVSAVATIGYLAFLVGPPALGALGHRYGLLNAFIVVLAVMVLAGLLSPVTSERVRK